MSNRRVTLPVVIFEGKLFRLEPTSFDEQEIQSKRIRKWYQKKNMEHTNENWSVLSSKVSKSDELVVIGMPVEELLKFLEGKKIIGETV